MPSTFFGFDPLPFDRIRKAATSAPPHCDLIDADTPEHARRTRALGTGDNYTLIMSDEFERPGRLFSAADGDPVWTAVSRHDPANDNLAYMTPQMVTTADGALTITTTDTGFRSAGQYASGSLQSWNKFCFQGGIVDVAYSLPGDPGLPGVWPAVWMLGNLARATFPLPAQGVWPWSYDACTPELDEAAGQLISACDEKPAAGLRARQGRGAVEIDILETRPCADLASWSSSPLELLVKRAAHWNQTCALSTLQARSRELCMYHREAM